MHKEREPRLIPERIRDVRYDMDIDGELVPTVMTPSIQNEPWVHGFVEGMLRNQQKAYLKGIHIRLVINGIKWVNGHAVINGEQ